MTAEYKDIIYLFNFVNGKQFQQIMRSMEDRECYRIPYEPDPYARITPQNGLDFFRGLLNLAGEKSMREKAAFLRRGKGRYEAKADTV
jgi:serine/threonine-protein kinase